jgi:hypothetical protein
MFRLGSVWSEAAGGFHCEAGSADSPEQQFEIDFGSGFPTFTSCPESDYGFAAADYVDVVRGGWTHLAIRYCKWGDCCLARTAKQ